MAINPRVVAISFLVPCAVLAQGTAPATPTEPSTPHEKLRFFEGTWTTSDFTSDQAFRETCAWLPEGRRHMVCRTRWNTASGPGEGMSIFSYDAASREYVYNGFRAGGTHIVQRGTEENGRWVLQSEIGKGPERLRNRVTIVPNKQGGFDFLGESSAGEGAVERASKLRIHTRTTVRPQAPADLLWPSPAGLDSQPHSF